MTRKKKIELPKLKYGEGSMSWDSKTEGLINYKKVVHIANGVSQRESVTGYTPEECFDNMSIREKELKDLYKKSKQNNHDYKELSLQDGIRQWLVQYKYGKIKEKSYDRIEQILENQIEKYPIGKILSYAVTSKDIENHLNDIKEKYSYSTLIKTYDLIHPYMNFLYKKAIEDNPMHNVQKPSKKLNAIQVDAEDGLISDISLSRITSSKLHVVTEQEILSDKEIELFKEEISRPYIYGVSGYRYGYGLYFIMLTFLRIGEALALQWKDIDWNNKTIVVNKNISTVKNRKYQEGSSERKYKRIIGTVKYENDRIVVLTNEAIDILKYHYNIMKPSNESEFIFISSNGKITEYRILYDSLKRIMKNAKLEKRNFSPHTLRHTGISYYIRHGVPVDVIAKMAGHSVDITKQVYYHIIKDQQDNALSLMNAIDRND